MCVLGLVSEDMICGPNFMVHLVLQVGVHLDMWLAAHLGMSWRPVVRRLFFLRCDFGTLQGLLGADTNPPVLSIVERTFLGDPWKGAS